MKRIALISLGIWMLISFCDRVDQQTFFTFTIQNQSFLLVYDMCENDPTCIQLNKIINNEPVVLAKDTNADGTLDWFSENHFLIDSLNRIYQTGVLLNDKCQISKDYVYSKYFFTQDSQYSFSMQTIIPVNGRISNRLVIQSRKENRKTIALDINADGIIENVSNADFVSNDIQTYYIKVLNKGLEKDAVTRNYDMLFIKYD